MPRYSTMNKAFIAARKVVLKAMKDQGVRVDWVEPLAITEASLELMRARPRKYSYPYDRLIPTQIRSLTP